MVNSAINDTDMQLTEYELGIRDTVEETVRDASAAFNIRTRGGVCNPALNV